jgi:hypothetical protein
VAIGGEHARPLGAIRPAPRRSDGAP